MWCSIQCWFFSAIFNHFGFDSKRQTQVNHEAPTLALARLAMLIHQVHPWWIWTKGDWWTCCCTENPRNPRNFTIFQLGDAPFTQEEHNLWLGWLRNLNVWSCRSIFVNVTPSHPGENLRKPRVHWKSDCWDANASSSNRDPILPPQRSWVRRWLQTATTEEMVKTNSHNANCWPSQKERHPKVKLYLQRHVIYKLRTETQSSNVTKVTLVHSAPASPHVVTVDSSRCQPLHHLVETWAQASIARLR